MSTAPRKRPSPSKSDFHNPYALDEEFPFGYRNVYKKDANGRLKSRKKPLSRWDVLHPREGDVQMNGEAHAEDMRYLADVFEAQLANDSNALVLSDVAIYWGDRELGHHCPDVSVILGVRPARRRKKSFRVKREGAKPQLLVEITSPTKRLVDLEEKVIEYYQAEVPFYVIVDDELRSLNEDAPRRLRILGFRRGEEGYERISLNKEGRLWLETVKVSLGIEGERVVCFDEAGKRIPNFAESRQALVEAEQRNAELEAELRRLRGAK